MSDNNTYKYYDSNYTPIAQGFNNPGTLCWCNSLLQLLLSLPSLNKTILECESKLKGNVFAQEYIRLVTLSLAGADTSNASMALLTTFTSRLKSQHMNNIIGNQQECVDEALTWFIEMFECPQIEDLFINAYELIITCNKCNNIASRTRDTSFRIQLFTRAQLDTTELFKNYLNAHASECTIFKCECGNIMHNFGRYEKLRMIREIIIIIFNKFQSKDNRWFPDTLSFKSKGGGYLNYKLVGKIEHSGTIYGGHYWAQCLRNEQWYTLNDASVSAGDGNPNSSTFMIAYHLVN